MATHHTVDDSEIIAVVGADTCHGSCGRFVRNGLERADAGERRRLQSDNQVAPAASAVGSPNCVSSASNDSTHREPSLSSQPARAEG